jgi:citrate lyase beta subunit
MVAAYLAERPQGLKSELWVRINPLDTGDALAD